MKSTVYWSGVQLWNGIVCVAYTRILWSICPTNTRNSANKRTHKHSCLWTLVSLVTFESVQEIGDNDSFHTVTHCSCSWILFELYGAVVFFYFFLLMCICLDRFNLEGAGKILKQQQQNYFTRWIHSLAPHFRSETFLAKRNTRKKQAETTTASFFAILTAMRFHRMTYPLSLSRLHITFPCISNSILLSS